MHEGCTLGIDIGTHGSKGVIVTKDGVVLGDSCCTHNLIIPKASYAEHNAFSWVNDFVLLTKLPLDSKEKQLRNAILYRIDN